MANDYLNVLRVSGSDDDVSEFVNLAQGESPLSFDRLVTPADGLEGPALEAWKVANWGTPDPIEAATPPNLFDERGIHVAEFTFPTRGGTPFALVDKLVESHPHLTFALATVEPMMRVAEIRVQRAGESWIYSIPDDELDGLIDEESGFPDEDLVLESLSTTAMSVVDDYERMPRIAPAP